MRLVDNTGSSNEAIPVREASQRKANVAGQEVAISAIDGYDAELRDINKKVAIAHLRSRELRETKASKQIFDNPELGYEEFQAHDNIVALLRSLEFEVTPHAFGVQTSFSCEVGQGGRVVVYNAEYDALPGIGHACGHNLIATSSIASFLGVAAALKASGKPGRVRLYGTPAEEGGGGKVRLIEAGAYQDVDACLMVHPGPPMPPPQGSHGHGGCCVPTGAAYGRSLANTKFNVTFTGQEAHAAMAPFQGRNALDAVVLGYNGVSMLRQQTRPYDRIHGVILSGGTRPNVITSFTKTQYYVRSATLKEASALETRVKACMDGAATATQCGVDYEMDDPYADLRPNRTICSLYADAMALPAIASPVTCDFEHAPMLPGSTDQGNVSYVVPSFHGGFAIPCPPGAYNHTKGFTACAGTAEAHKLAIDAAKGMAVAGLAVLTDEAVAAKIWEDFKADRALDEKTTD
ncbi:amidohydrolase [Cordyceps fumosorosea ARSEF 2679]|uniref:Peptidase M20 domain-containing protein 2 n=1 Tax=Cordyceps fumosorosea (strain ARSEF 2679) TaxID=1081104 RepID=A0A168D9T8_CORFA|nr:amidohydrolase [Cordyceps fumosorosea ARSEF 2679]OAA72336.1 amidohydrolase [Cordyceps fumosorosea ARSEF 2679]